MKKLLAAAVLLWSCATRAADGGTDGGVCLTRCGVSALHGDCTELRRYETAALLHLERAVPEFTYLRVCHELNGWKIEAHRHDPLLDRFCGADSWQLFPGFCASGYTHADTKVIELGEVPWSVSPLIHEYAHVADYSITGKVNHCRWANPALPAAISDFMGEPDNVKPGASCFVDAGTPDAG